ncbi:hypothetical protein LXA43DRAFT_430171 [Ganoderma leucocontextum]|nr:hypothetical protein LXA43DRAFT_430171 [Ganoderma leucocontextum]
MMDEPTVQKSLIPRLPPEIIGQILRFFSNDREALLNYALVSQDWLFESRPFLFRNINILDRDPGNLFVSDVLHSERLRPWLTSIHHLSFGFMGTPNEESFILDISEHLSNLRTMKWGSFSPLENGYPLRAEVFPALGKFAHLHHLEIVDCRFASFKDLKKVIVAFPSLTSLSLTEVAWNYSAEPDELSSGLPSTHIWPTMLSKLSLSTPYHGSQEAIDHVLQWLSATPTRHLLKELSFDLCNIAAALRLIADTSLTVLGIQMDDDDQLLDDNAPVAQLQRVISQVRHIDLLRLAVILDSWQGVAVILRLFGSISSIHRLRLCCSSGSYLPYHYCVPEFDDASAQQLETVLLAPSEEANAFRTLRAVEFAWHFETSNDGTLEEQYYLFSWWMERVLPRLRERYTVELYTYNDASVFGPMGLSEHAGGAEFPHAEK